MPHTPVEATSISHPPTVVPSVTAATIAPVSSRTGALLTTLVPWRPPGNRTPTEAEVQACLPFLLRRLQLIRPRRLVLLGGLAAKALTGSAESARRLRGRWRPAVVPGLDAPIPALPMLPLEQVARSAALKQATWTDLLTLRLALNTD